jgi:HEAT repeat protein
MRIQRSILTSAVLVLTTLVALCTALSADAAPLPDDTELFQRLKDPDARTRRVAAEALGKRKVESAIPALAELIKDKQASVSKAAGDALGRMGPRSLASLTAALKDPSEQARSAALWGFVRMGAPSKVAVREISALLKDEVVPIRIQAAMLLGSVGAEAKAALPALYEAARDTSNLDVDARDDRPSSVSAAAIEAAMKIDPDCGAALAKAAMPALIAELKKPPKGRGFEGNVDIIAAAEALALLGPHAKSELPALEECYNAMDDYDPERALAKAILTVDREELKRVATIIKDGNNALHKRLILLEKLGWSAERADQAVGIIVEALKDPEPSIRTAAMNAIDWGIGPKAKSAIPALVKMLGEDVARASPSRYDDAANALGRIGAEAVPALTAVLKDKDKAADVRYQAARALEYMGRSARAGLPAIEVAMKDPDQDIALQAASAYVMAGGDMDKALPIFQELLKDKSSTVVFKTAEKLERLAVCSTRARDAAPALISLLKHNDSKVRYAAADALGRMGPAARPAVPAIAELLKTAGPHEQFHVFYAIENLGPDAKEALPALLELLKNFDDTLESRNIFRVVGSLGPHAKPAVPVLVELLKRSKFYSAQEVIGTLGQIGPDAREAVPEIINRLKTVKDQRPDVPLRALGLIGPDSKQAVPLITQYLEDESEGTRAWAAFALARILDDSKSQVPVLVELWKDALPPDQQYVRYEVAQALDLLGPDSRPARDLLLEALLDKSTETDTRERVVNALGHLASDADVIVPKLVALMERPAKGRDRIENCENCARALGMLGPAAKAAIPALRKLLHDDDNFVVKAATLALEKIEK